MHLSHNDRAVMLDLAFRFTSNHFFRTIAVIEGSERHSFKTVCKTMTLSDAASVLSSSSRRLSGVTNLIPSSGNALAKIACIPPQAASGLVVNKNLTLRGSLSAKSLTIKAKALLPPAATPPLNPRTCCSGGSPSSRASTRINTCQRVSVINGP